MKVTLEVNGHGELVAPSGRILGRVVDLGLEVDDPAICKELGGTIGGASYVSGSTDEQKKERNEKERKKSPRERNIEIVWAHYIKLFGDRYQFNPKRKRIIDNALSVRPLDAVLRALDGLKTSKFHNGENDQRQTYLDIRYALSGNQRTGESIEERIDKMGADVRREVVDGSEDGIPGWVQRNFDAMVRAYENQRYITRWRENIDSITAAVRDAGFDVTFDTDGRPLEVVKP
jgi:hypothetical protein